MAAVEREAIETAEAARERATLAERGLVRALRAPDQHRERRGSRRSTCARRGRLPCSRVARHRSWVEGPSRQRAGTRSGGHRRRPGPLASRFSVGRTERPKPHRPDGRSPQEIAEYPVVPLDTLLKVTTASVTREGFGYDPVTGDLVRGRDRAEAVLLEPMAGAAPYRPRPHSWMHCSLTRPGSPASRPSERASLRRRTERRRGFARRHSTRGSTGASLT